MVLPENRRHSGNIVGNPWKSHRNGGRARGFHGRFIWLVTGTMEFWMTFHSVGNGKSSQLTNSLHHFSEGYAQPLTSGLWNSLWNRKNGTSTIENWQCWQGWHMLIRCCPSHLGSCPFAFCRPLAIHCYVLRLRQKVAQTPSLGCLQWHRSLTILRTLGIEHLHLRFALLWSFAVHGGHLPRSWVWPRWSLWLRGLRFGTGSTSEVAEPFGTCFASFGHAIHLVLGEGLIGIHWEFILLVVSLHLCVSHRYCVWHLGLCLLEGVSLFPDPFHLFGFTTCLKSPSWQTRMRAMELGARSQFGTALLRHGGHLEEKWPGGHRVWTWKAPRSITWRQDGCFVNQAWFVPEEKNSYLKNWCTNRR